MKGMLILQDYSNKQTTSFDDFVSAYNARVNQFKPKIVPEDYIGEDGLYYCHLCNTPKQSRYILGGKERIVTHLCECQTKARDEYEEWKKFDSLQLELRHRRASAFQDSEYRNWTFDIDDGSNPEATAIALSYAKNFREMMAKSKGLLFYGDIGTGKSFLAASIVNYVMEHYFVPCLVTNMTRIGSAVQSMKDPQGYLDYLNEYELLVIDDFRSERDTPWMKELVYSVINARYMSGKPLIVTTNLKGEEMLNAEDRSWQRVYSRLYEMCKPIKIEFSDRRKLKMLQSNEEMECLLGMRGDNNDTGTD